MYSAGHDMGRGTSQTTPLILAGDHGLHTGISPIIILGAFVF